MKLSITFTALSLTRSNSLSPPPSFIVLLIAAAGNGGNTAKSYPASFTAVMSIAAVNSGKNIASFSQRNDQVELSGPGVDVLSTYPGNYLDYLSGTSMVSSILFHI